MHSQMRQSSRGFGGGGTAAKASPHKPVLPAAAPQGSTFCVMLPDTGERYLSTVLFEHLTADSDDEWLAEQS